MLRKRSISYKRFLAFVTITGCISLLILCIKLSRHHHRHSHTHIKLQKLPDLNENVDNWPGWLWEETAPTTIEPTDAAELNNQAEEFTLRYYPALHGGITCSDLIDRTKSRRPDVRQYAGMIDRKVFIPDEDFHTVAEYCESFARSRGYLSKPVSLEELDFPLAFGIIMHQNVQQVEQLLRTIYRPQNTYCIHVDSKAPSEVLDGMRAISKCFKNVYIASKLVRMAWGTASLIEAEMACQYDAYHKNKKWKYFINLTGRDFPLKTNLEMVRILREFNGQNDIITSKDIHLHRLFYVHKTVADTVVNTYTLRTDSLPKQISVKRGDHQCALSRLFVRFVHRTGVAKEWLKWLNKTSFPEESFYQSLASLPNVPGGPGPNDVSYAISRANNMNQDNQPCIGESVDGVCIYSWHELPWLALQPHLFANRFDASHDGVALRCLEEEINHRTYNQDDFNIDLYKRFVESRILNATDIGWRVA